MNNDILNKLIRRLRIEFFAMWILATLLFVLYEAGLLEEGSAIHDGRIGYILQSVCVLLTLILIPFSLKMFSVAIQHLAQKPLEKALVSYIRLSEIRIALLAVVVLVGLSIYYATLNSIGGLCALLGLLASLFCFPNEKRIKEELGL